MQSSMCGTTTTEAAICAFFSSPRLTPFLVDQSFVFSPGAIRAPSEKRTEQSVTDLVQQLKGVPKVVFHCSLSQVRGPKAARIYAEALAASQPSVPALGSSASQSSASTAQGAAESARNFSPNPYLSTGQTGGQEVLVLRDGFSNWQGLYRVRTLILRRLLWRAVEPDPLFCRKTPFSSRTSTVGSGRTIRPRRPIDLHPLPPPSAARKGFSGLAACASAAQSPASLARLPRDRQRAYPYSSPSTFATHLSLDDAGDSSSLHRCSLVNS